MIILQKTLTASYLPEMKTENGKQKTNPLSKRG
jgi:hypothetical protein